MDNKERVVAYQTQLWTKHNVDAVFTYFSPDAIIHSSIQKLICLDAMKEALQAWIIGMPDIKVYYDAILPQENKVISLWHCKGAHSGYFLGIPPSNNLIQYKGITVYEFKNDLIQEYWAIVDIENIKQQCRSIAIQE